MAEQKPTTKRCRRCNLFKSLDAFYANCRARDGLYPACIVCFYEARPFIDTTCKDCGKVEQRRTDYAKSRWGGRCRNCASRLNNTRPEVMAQRVQNRLKTMNEWTDERKQSRVKALQEQLARQGGIPNRQKFVKEGEDGRRMAGPNHYAWKGGLPRGNQRTSYFYDKWRKAVFQRDDYTCRMCGRRGGVLEADHVKPWSTHPELRYELSNGRTLCKPCHQTTDTYGGRMFTYLKTLSREP